MVKVRREGLRPLVDADLRLLSHAASLAEAQWPDLARYRPREVLNHLGAAMAEELDLAAEARNCEAIAANLAEMSFILVPRIHWQWTSGRLLVQEFVGGVAPNDRAALDAANHDTALLARRGAEAFLHMALVDGLFHADPHPGNLRALPGDRIAFIDFGMVGRIGGRRRDQLLGLLSAIVDGSGDRVANLLLEWSGAASADLSQLEAGCDVFVARHGTPPLRLGDAIVDFVALAREHDLALPPDLALLFKALITADGVMRSLDPQFDAIAVAAPIVRSEMLRRYAPAALAGRSKALAVDLAGMASDLPSLIRYWRCASGKDTSRPRSSCRGWSASATTFAGPPRGWPWRSSPPPSRLVSRRARSTMAPWCLAFRCRCGLASASLPVVWCG